MNNLSQVFSFINEDLATIAMLMNGKAEASNAGKEAAGSLADAIRQLAQKTHDEGISVEELVGSKGRRGAFQLGLELQGAPSGTVNGSGNHLKGYRAMLAAGKPIEGVSTAGAQLFIASDEVKAKRAAQAAFRAATKDWKAADWVSMLEKLDITLGLSSSEASEIVAEARAA